MNREHPLLMRPELVVATLAGRKTQTRRLVTPATSTVEGKPAAREWSVLDFGRAMEQQGAAADTPVWIHSWAEPGQTLEQLPEGLEGRDVIAGTASATVGGTAELATGDERTEAEDAPTLPDSVVIHGVEYEVVASGPRRVGAAGVVTWQTFLAARVQR